VAAILAGTQKYLYLGNLDAKRDWGYAPEYVECMWEMLQHEQPVDLVIGTGESHTVREFLEEAFGYVGLDYNEYVRIDPKYFRPTEVDYLLADPSKSRSEIGWKPRVLFSELVRVMIDADLELIGLESPGEGVRVLEEKFGDWHHWKDQVVSMEK
jgi:GDPmannose 4,6-dehydratase